MPTLSRRKLYTPQHAALYVGASAAPAGYQGPGDIVGSAYAWWGLRAYTAALIGNNILDVFYSEDATTITYVSIAGGGLNTALIAADTAIHNPLGAAPLVDKLYDQTGNGRHLTVGGFIRSTLVLTGNGLTVPNMAFTNAGGTSLENTSFGTHAQPLTYGVVANHTASGSPQNLLLTVMVSNFVLVGQYHSAAVNDVMVGYAGTATTPQTLNDGTWASLQSTFTNSTGDRTAVNGSQTTGTDLGPNTLDTTLFLSHPAGRFDGFVTECGIWPVAFTGTQMTNMYNNQKAYYGLP